MSSDKSRGFTLVEVMIALGIFALAAIAAVMASSQHLNNLNYMQDKTFARYAAANALARMSLELPPEAGRTGSEYIANQNWPWRADVVKTTTENVVMVSVHVYEPGSDALDTDYQLYTLSRYVGVKP